MRDDRPVLLFDSGVGGLTVARAVRRAVPGARLVYAADSAGFPYGVKHEAEIAGRVPALLGRLVERYRARLAVVACNTASTIALGAVRAALDVAVVGTVPAIKPAAAASRARAIGVLGTRATVRQAYVDDLANRFAADCLVVRHGSAELVELAEERLRGDAVDPASVRAALAGLRDQPGGERIDVVVAACTHFPLLADELAQAAAALWPHPPVFIDGAAGISRRVAQLTAGEAWEGAGEDVAVFTRLGEDEARLAPALARWGFSRIEAL